MAVCCNWNIQPDECQGVLLALRRLARPQNSKNYFLLARSPTGHFLIVRASLPLPGRRWNGTPASGVLCCFQKSRLVALAEKSEVGQQGMKRAVRMQ